MWEVLAAILHIGNLSFEKVANKNAEDGSKVRDESMATMKVVAKLLKCDYELLDKGMTCSLVKVTGETQPIEVPQSTESCVHARDALSKVIYEKLFAWLVGCINECLQASDALAGISDAEKKKIEAHFIGVLDIFGFEVFENNSFEQLCINYANESLQQQFINQMLHAMMAQYEKEGVKVDAIPFEDNSPCVELLESKMGIFSMLDDECNFPKGTDETFLGKLMDSHKGHSHLKPGGSSSDPHLKDNQTPAGKTTMGGVRGRLLTVGEAFVVSHFAGEVEYSVRSFLEKNRDTINESLKTVLNGSEQPLMKKLLVARADDDAGAAAEAKPGRMIGGRLVGGTGARGVGARGAGRSMAQRKEDKRSLGSQFKMQLSELVGLIESGRAHYVRCIKPNALRRPHTFEAPSVIRQLRCSGVTETVRARRAGWPVSHSFEDFVKRYIEVYMSLSKAKKPPADLLPILKFFLASEDEWRIGTSKVFLRDQSSSRLEERYKVYRLNCKLLVQARVRAMLQWMRYRKWAGASLSIQKNFRMWSAVNRRKTVMAAMRTLQQMARAKLTRQLFRGRCAGAQCLQASARRSGRRRLQAASRAGAVRLQAAVQRTSARRLYALRLAKEIEKERELERLRKEEEQRLRLAEEERARAALLAQEKHKIEAQADELCEETLQSIKEGQLDMAREQLELATTCYQQAGRADKDDVIRDLERQLAKAAERERERGQGEAEMQRADDALARGDSAGAKDALHKAKAHAERALAADMSEQIERLMAKVQQEDDKELYVREAAAAEDEAERRQAGGDLSGASQAIERAKASSKRAGVAPPGSLAALEAAVGEGLKQREAAEAAKAREEEELKKMSEAESKAAEEQARAMEKEVKAREREVSERALQLEQKQLQVPSSPPPRRPPVASAWSYP